MRKRVFFIYTERFSDFNSMIEQYEKEMRRIFESGPKEKVYEEEKTEEEHIEPLEKYELQKEISSSVKPDGKGSIVVEVTTARGAVPISGADVVIDRLDLLDPMGRKELMAVRTTGPDGRTEPVFVETVSKDLSLSPGSANPFSTFYVSTAYKGFAPQKNLPVDVFSNEVSILKIDLVPLPEKLYEGRGENG